MGDEWERGRPFFHILNTKCNYRPRHNIHCGRREAKLYEVWTTLFPLLSFVLSQLIGRHWLSSGACTERRTSWPHTWQGSFSFRASAEHNSHLLSNTAIHNITCIGKGGAIFSGRKYNCLLHKGHLHLSTKNTQILIISLGTKDLDRVRYWEHRNFSNPRHRLLCGDGVHLNQEEMAKYWHSLRGAILYAEHH